MMPGTLLDVASMIVGKYDAMIRANRSPDWDTLAAVDDCDEGLYGAWGEVLDVAYEGGWLIDQVEGADDPDNLLLYDLLSAVYDGWRIGLRGQVQLEANYRAWRERT